MKMHPILLLLLFLYTSTTGQVCRRRLVNGKWTSLGDCGASSQASQSVISDIQRLVDKEIASNSQTNSPTAPSTTDTGGPARPASDGMISTETTTNLPKVKTTTSPGPDWEKSGNRFFKCFNDDPKTYQQAKDNCTSYGGRLAAEVLRDPVAVEDIASNCLGSYSNRKRPWIGFDEIAEEGKWVWSDGGAMNKATTQWHPGEPNNYGGNEESCAQISKTSSVGTKILLNDNICGYSSQYICEV